MRPALALAGALALAILSAGCGDSDADDPVGSDRADAVYEKALREGIETKRDRLEAKLRRKRRQAREEAESPATRSSSAAKLDELGERLGAQVGGTIGLPGQEPLVAGSLQSGSAWSTIKVSIALAVGERSGGFDDSQRELVDRAITLSDNDAAAALFAELGAVGPASSAVSAVLSEAGDAETKVSTEGRDGFSTYGQTEWSQLAQSRFMSSLLAGSVGESSSRRYVLDRMGAVTADTWGLGSAGVPGLWKGGWGPGTDGSYLLRQMGALEIGGCRYVATLAAIPDAGTFEAGQPVATEVARWLVDHAPSPPPDGC